MMEIIDGSARYANAQGTAIDCLVMLNGTSAPYTASEADPSTSAVWTALQGGAAGGVAEFVEQSVPPDINAYRASAMRAIVEHIDVITASALTAYPRAEVESWSIQKAEAEAILAAAEPTLAMAPFLVGVCLAQFGEADDTARLAQVIDKAGLVKANADAWAAMAAYVNGLRARTQIAILEAEDISGIDSALAAGIAEGDAFKGANGL